MGVSFHILSARPRCFVFNEKAEWKRPFKKGDKEAKDLSETGLNRNLLSSSMRINISLRAVFVGGFVAHATLGPVAAFSVAALGICEFGISSRQRIVLGREKERRINQGQAMGPLAR